MVKAGGPVPVAGIVSDGPHSIRKADRQVLPDVPDPWCHFPVLREAARPLDEADRHAKKELKRRCGPSAGWSGGRTRRPW